MNPIPSATPPVDGHVVEHVEPDGPEKELRIKRETLREKEKEEIPPVPPVLKE